MFKSSSNKSWRKFFLQICLSEDTTEDVLIEKLLEKDVIKITWYSIQTSDQDWLCQYLKVSTYRTL